MPAANRLRFAMMLYREPACAHVRWLTAGGIFCREAQGEQSEPMVGLVCHELMNMHQSSPQTCSMPPENLLASKREHQGHSGLRCLFAWELHSSDCLTACYAC